MTPRPNLWPDETYAAAPWLAMSSHAPPPMPATYEELRLLRRTVTGMVGAYRNLVFGLGPLAVGSSVLDWGPTATSCPQHVLDTVLDLLRGAVGR